MAQEYNIDIKRYNGSDYDTLLPRPQSHASTHEPNGSDPLIIDTSSIANNAVTQKITATILSSSWINEPSTESCRVESLVISGMDSSSNFIIDVDEIAGSPTPSVEVRKQRDEAWKPFEVRYSSTGLFVRMYGEPPTIDIPIKILKIKK